MNELKILGFEITAMFVSMAVLLACWNEITGFILKGIMKGIDKTIGRFIEIEWVD